VDIWNFDAITKFDFLCVFTGVKHQIDPAVDIWNFDAITKFDFLCVFSFTPF